MTEVYQFSEAEMLAFTMVLLRLTAFVVVWPIFGVESVPPQLKVLFGVVLAVLLLPVIDTTAAKSITGAYDIMGMAAREVFIGLFYGFLTRVFFFILKMAGEMISVSIGLSGAQLFNPAMGGMTTPTDTFFYALGALVFLLVQGHHFLLLGLQDSFRILPVGALSIHWQGMLTMGEIVQSAVLAGLTMAAPVFVAILVANVAMGILGKTVPQINVLITSLAANALLGLVVLTLALPHTMDQMEKVLFSSMGQAFKVLRTL